jgi:hypothetical protein
MAGNASGPADGGRPSTGPGGLGIRIDGAQQGKRDNINFQNGGGVAWSAVDNPGADRVDVSASVTGGGEVELGSVQINLLTTSVADILNAIGITESQVDRLVIRAVDVSGVTVQPSIEVGTGTGPPNNDHATATALTLPSSAWADELVVLSPRPTLGAATVLRVRRTVTPSATTYVIEVTAFGSVITP